MANVSDPVVLAPSIDLTASHPVRLGSDINPASSALTHYISRSCKARRPVSEHPQAGKTSGNISWCDDGKPSMALMARSP